MAKNLTGLPNTGDYTLGRGIVYLTSLNASDKPDDAGWRDVGNSPDFTVSVETETLEHQSSRQGLRVVDKEVILSQTMSLAFQLDELNDTNLSLFLSGSTATHTNPAKSNQTNVLLSTAVVLGRWYDLVDSNGERLYDIDKTGLSLREVGTPTTLVENTDYTVDEKMGRVFILSGATNIAAGEDLDYSYTTTGAEKDADEVRGLTQGNIIVGVKFIAENPANANKKREYQFHKVTLRSEGELPLIGDEFATMGFAGTVENAPLADADAPFVRIRDHGDS